MLHYSNYLAERPWHGKAHYMCYLIQSNDELIWVYLLLHLSTFELDDNLVPDSWKKPFCVISPNCGMSTVFYISKHKLSPLLGDERATPVSKAINWAKVSHSLNSTLVEFGDHINYRINYSWQTNILTLPLPMHSNNKSVILFRVIKAVSQHDHLGTWLYSG